MTSKERFETAISHKTPDRPPIDYLAEPGVNKKLFEYFKINSEDELLAILNSDFYYLSCRDISQNESCFPFYRGPKLAVNETERVCPFGIKWKRQAYNSKFSVDNAISGPLETVTSPKEILDYKWPEKNWFNWEPLIEECENHSDKVIVGGLWTGIFGDSYRMHGFQNFLLNMALNPDLIHTLVNKMTDFYLDINDQIFNLMKGKMDVWFWGNDYGTQQGLLFDGQMFGEFFLPNIKKLNDLAHSYNLRVMMHSCGAISPLIPLLTEAGVDILDPVQVTAEGMSPTLLKAQFGEQIVFHGGIDTQHVLPFGSPNEVYAHAKETLEIMNDKGGYIFAPSQILKTDIPVENIVAMYRAALKF